MRVAATELQAMQALLSRDRPLGMGCPYRKIGALVRDRPEDVGAYIEQNMRGKE
jgi:hypothetical protein